MNIVVMFLRKLVATKERKKLLSSLSFNFVAKLPGLLSVFVVLPLISKALGASVYGELLSALALGSSFCLPFGGVKTVARRHLAQAYGKEDRKEQADIFVTSSGVAAGIALLMAFCLFIASKSTGTPTVIFIVSLIPVISAFFDNFDSLRSSFNEHYITAKFQLVSQVVIYGALLVLGLPDGAILLAGFSMNPYLFASICTFALLIAQRPYLKKGKIKGVKKLLASSFAVTLSDGLLTTSLSFSVYWLSQAASVDYAAWIGTITRLFLSFMSPIMLVLFPLTGFIAMRWGTLSKTRRLQMNYIFIGISILMGVVVGGLISLLGPLYVDHMFKLRVTGDAVDVWSLGLFLGAIITQKSYTMLIYSFCEGKFISYGTSIVVCFAAACTLLAFFYVPANKAIDVFYVIAGVSLPFLVFVENSKQRCNLRKEQDVFFQSEINEV